MNADEQPKISVVIRKRPLNKKQLQKNETDIVSVKNGETVIVSEYNKAVRPLVQSAFMGARVTCFAYGQTGSGKTYTMNGDLNGGVPGLYILGARDIFAYQSNVFFTNFHQLQFNIPQKQFQHLKIQVSFFEIYCGRLFDLLNNRSELKLREDNKANVHIVGLEERPLFSPEEFMQVIEYGSKIRITSQNSTNADSSRSHAILQITLKEGKKVYGKISFIDLAGCERGADHMDQNKQTRIDGAQINKSLLSLKECIRALDQGKGHTPFRGSKLTMVLKDSFVGFCKTVMIGNISPNISSCENTLNTLRYADRVKELKKPGDGEAMSKEDRLAKELMLPRTGKNAVKIMIDSNDDAEDIQLKKLEAQRQLGIKGSMDFDAPPPPQPQNNNAMMGNGNMMGNNRGKMIVQQPMRGANTGSNSLMAGKKAPTNQSVPKVGLRKQPERVAPNLNQRPSDLFDPRNQFQNNRENTNQGNKSTHMNVQPPPSLNSNNLFPNTTHNNYFQGQQNTQSSQNSNNNWGARNVQNEQIQVRQANNSSPNHANNNFNFGNNNYPQNQNGNAFGNQGFGNNGMSPGYNQGYGNQGFPNNMQNNQQGFFQNNGQPNQYNNSQPQPLFNGNKNPQAPMQGSYNFNQAPGNSQQFMNRPTVNPNSPGLQQQSIHQQQQQMMNSQMMQQQRSNNQPQFDWKGIVTSFGEWDPTNGQANPANMQRFKEGLEFLMDQLLQEENRVAAAYSNSVGKEVETIKQEMKVISEFESDKDNYESIEYANFIERNIDSKINELMSLKKKVTDFKQHLLQFEECEQKLNSAMDQMENDEQLLDDLDNNQEQLY